MSGGVGEREMSGGGGEREKGERVGTEGGG